MVSNCFERYIPSTLHKIAAAVNTGLEFIYKQIPSLTIEDRMDLKLVLSELLYNAAIHGNNLDPHKFVHFVIEIHKNNIINATIEDEGAGFNYQGLIRNMQTNTQNYAENGRGLQLALSLCDRFNFNKTGNVINFSKKVALDHVQHNNSWQQFKDSRTHNELP